MATTQPGGLTIDPATGAVSMSRIETSGAVPTPMPGATGSARPGFVASQAFPGSAVTSFVNGDGQQTNRTIWFGADGAPHLRDAAGVLVGMFTQDATITVTGGTTLTVRQSTGAVE
jgi:hypothetical protein